MSAEIIRKDYLAVLAYLLPLRLDRQLVNAVIIALLRLFVAFGRHEFFF